MSENSIYLAHGSGYANVGDSAQMYATVLRLEKHFPGYQILVSDMYEQNDQSVPAGRKVVPSPMPHLRKTPSFANRISRVLGLVGLGRVGKGIVIADSLARSWWVVAATRIYRATGVLPISSRSAREAIRCMATSKGIVCSGGGNLNEIWLTQELIPRTTIYAIANVLDKPLVISGQQVGPISARISKWLLRKNTRKAIIFSCRDMNESAELLAKAGIRNGLVRSLGDDATDLEPSDASRVDEIFAREGIVRDGRPIVAVHIRLQNWTDFFPGDSATLAKLVDALIERLDCRVVFIPVTYGVPRFADGDLADALQVYSSMKHRQSATFLCAERYIPPDMKAFVGSCSALIGFSYHAWVFAMTQGLPAFAFYKGDYFRSKSEGFFGWYDREHWAWDLGRLDVDVAVNTIAEALANAKAHSEFLLTRTREIAEKVQLPVRMLRDVLDPSGQA